MNEQIGAMAYKLNWLSEEMIVKYVTVMDLKSNFTSKLF